jgi:hypothetical protein
MTARHPMLRTALVATGVLLLAIAPVVGVLPGPGGLVLAGLGLTFILRNARWAKRWYAAAKKRWPKAGHWADLGMRRGSARRRNARRRALAE